MTRFTKTGAALAALTIGLSALAGPAQAKPKFYPKKIGYYHHHKHSYAPLAAAGIMGALAIGAVAASAGPSCYIEERERVDAYGNVFVREVRVCE